MGPTPEQVQRKIAEEMGWTNLGAEPNMVGTVPGGDYAAIVPNWPESIEDAINLRDEETMLRLHGYPGGLWVIYYTSEVKIEDKSLAQGISLAWLLYKGWRWVTCPEDECHNGQWRAGECPTCSGAGGEFERVK